MAAKKTDAEKGPLGAWAYHTRLLLQASSVDAATAAGIKDTYLRKIEGGSARKPAQRTVFDLWQYYRRLGQAQSVPVEDPPPEWRGDPSPVQSVSPADLATALVGLTAELAAWRKERQGLLDRVAQLEAQVDELVVDRDAPGNATPAAHGAHPTTGR